MNTVSGGSATGRKLADGPPLCRTQDRGDCGHHLQRCVSPPPCCWAPPTPPLGWPEKGVQKRPPGPPGPLPDACRDAQGGPTGTNEVSVCGSQEELRPPPVARHIPTGKPTESSVLMSMVVIKRVSHMNRPPNHTDTCGAAPTGQGRGPRRGARGGAQRGGLWFSLQVPFS